MSKTRPGSPRPRPAAAKEGRISASHGEKLLPRRLSGRLLAALLLGVAAAGAAAVFLMKPVWLFSPKPVTRITTGPAAGYVGSESCATCHAGIAESYKHIAMGRSVYRPADAPVIEDFTSAPLYHHKASNQYFAMSREGDRVFQTRYQKGPGGERLNEKKVEAHFVIGSGTNARAYANQGPDGQLYLLPVNWYTQEKSWGMGPGYDTPAHPGFSRRITYDCAFCHADYPHLSPGMDKLNYPETSLFPDGIEAISCERCHGPGAQHAQVAAASPGDLEKIKSSIVNPANLSPELQMDTCMQCHLESTSEQLPRAVQRVGQEYFSYRPGQPLGDYAVAFDHPRGTGHDDKFEIAHQAYRLRMSKCFTASEGQMTCTTCHDPHKVPKNRIAVQLTNCMQCHDRGDEPAEKRTAGRTVCTEVMAKRLAEKDNCITCHMPRRRTDDVVHIAMTDHFIQRHKPEGDLLAPRRENHSDTYRGDISPYYPDNLGNEEDLYVGMGLIKEGANVEKGVSLLSKWLISNEPNYAALLSRGAGLKAMGRNAEALDDLQKAAAHNPSHPGVQVSLADLYTRMGNLDKATAHDENAVALQPTMASAQIRLGRNRIKQGDRNGAREAFEAAVEKDPLTAEPHLALGSFYLEQGERAAAEKSLLEALALDPAKLEANQAISSLLAKRGEFAKAVWYGTMAVQWEQFAPNSFPLVLNAAAQMPPSERDRLFGTITEQFPLEGRILWALDLASRRSPDSAVGRLKEAEALQSSNGGLLIEAGLLAVQLQQPDLGRRFFRGATATMPSDENAVLGIAGMLAQRGGPQAAAQMIAAVLETRKANPRLQQALGQYQKQ